MRTGNGRIYSFGIKLYNSSGESVDPSVLNVRLPQGRVSRLVNSWEGDYLILQLGENELALIEGLNEGQYIKIAEVDDWFEADEVWSDEDGNVHTEHYSYVRYVAEFSSNDGNSELGLAGYRPSDASFINFVTAFNKGPIPSAGLPSISTWDGF